MIRGTAPATARRNAIPWVMALPGSFNLNFIKSPPIQIISRLRSLIVLEYLVDVIML